MYQSVIGQHFKVFPDYTHYYAIHAFIYIIYSMHVFLYYVCYRTCAHTTIYCRNINNMCWVHYTSQMIPMLRDTSDLQSFYAIIGHHYYYIIDEMSGRFSTLHYEISFVY